MDLCFDFGGQPVCLFKRLSFLVLDVEIYEVLTFRMMNLKVVRCAQTSAENNHSDFINNCLVPAREGLCVNNEVRVRLNSIDCLLDLIHDPVGTFERHRPPDCNSCVDEDPRSRCP